MKLLRNSLRRRTLVVAVAFSGSAILAVSDSSNLVAAAEEEGYGSNLSVPAVFMPNSTASDAPSLRGGTCGSSILPTGSMSLDFPGYYIQKAEPTWQAECVEVTELSVFANWGDNLTSRPVLSSRQPIRVEVGLEYSPTIPMKGFVVEKLTPDEEDRLATYGTRRVLTDFAKVRVFDSGATLMIERIDGPGGVIYNGPMSAEINSVGAVVYGYNWGVKGKTNRALPGSYRVTFTTNNSRLVGVDASDAAKATFTTRSTSIVVNVSATSGLKGKPSSGSGSSGGGSSGGSGTPGAGHGSGGHER